MPNNKATANKFHVVLSNGEERDVLGTEAVVQDGALVIRSHAGNAILYAEGQWTLCEWERKDDR